MLTHPPLAGKRLLRAALAAAVVLPLVFSLGSAKARPGELFFSEYVEGTSNNKALEIYNGTGASVDLAAGGYAVQMCFNGSASCGLTIGLTGTVADGDVYVLAQSSASPVILAQADQTNGSGWFNGDDAILLLKGTAVVDSIGQQGFDPGTEWGAGATSTMDNTLRRRETVESGDTNPLDAFDPAVQWDGFPTDDFTGLGGHLSDAAPAVASTSPASGAVDVPVDADVSITFSEPVSVSGDWFAISCTTSGDHTAIASGGPETYSLDPDADFVQEETCTVTVVAAQTSDQDVDDPPDTMAADHTFSFDTTRPPTPIHDIQGAAHRSPLEGDAVANVPGIVTAKASNGFYMQDPEPDADNATSEAIFVFGTAAAAPVGVGDSVEVDARVAEFRPGGASSTNLTTTELTSPSVTILSSGNPLPAPTVLGTGGRVPPATIIDDDATGSVETSGTFDPASDGIDFYESLEATHVQVNAALAVGPTSAFGEIPVVGDGGANAGVRTARGGVVISASDFNPERIMLDDTLAPTPLVNVADGFTTAPVGVLDYSFGNFKLLVTAPLVGVDGGLERERTRTQRRKEVAIATFNVENLDPGDGAAKFDELARLIVENLRSPDLLGLEEVQDDNGPVNDEVTDATLTYEMLIAAIRAAGGPRYHFRQIDPVDDQEGGEPGGNIRVGFLFRSDRGLRFVDRPGGDSTTPTTVVGGRSGARLSFSPGRVAPGNPAFEDTRVSLAGEFEFKGERIIAIVNHFSSKGGDQPLFGHFQPPTRSTEPKRHAQAQAINDFVDQILAAQRRANVVVLGDLNDFEFSETLSILEGGVLENLMDSLPKRERYSYVFEGNSQVLDQILVSRHLGDFRFAYDVVHVNSEFAGQSSDHEPQVARFEIAER